MSTTHQEAPPASAFHLDEAVAVPASPVQPDGTVHLHVIRPGIGRGRGKHLYEAEMLQENASKFAGWKMYVDHLSPEARKAAHGLPRSVHDLGGRVEEAWWDPSVPADPEKGWGQGAVVGRVKPVKFIRELIEDDPHLVEASISATATNVRPAMRNGQKVWLVEGIEPRGSVDWVTEAGAGGRVAPLLEALVEEGDLTVLEGLTDEEVMDHLRETRPHLIEAAATTDDEEQTVDVTPEALQEALETDEGKAVVRGLVESVLVEERELIRAEARADADRQLALRDMRDSAFKAIAESKLPESWQDRLRGEYQLVEGKPASKLDVLDDVDADGKVTKAASVKLQESLESDIADSRLLLAEANPTRVRGQGPARTEDGKELTEAEKAKQPKPYWMQILQEAGVDPDKAYAEA